MRLTMACLCLSLMAFVACQAPKPAQQSEELQIIYQDWNAAVEAAKSQDKLILIDFYTTWCPPCKIFDKAVKDRKEFSSAIAKDYIMLKYDAEQDSSHGLTLKHHICSYPTYITLNPNGKVMNKQYGRFDSTQAAQDRFVAFLDKGAQLNEEKQYLTGIAPEITGLDYPEFYKEYVYRVKFSTKQLPDFWESRTDYSDELSFILMAYFGGSDEANAYFLDNLGIYRERYGQPDVDFVLGRIARKKLKDAVKAKDEAAFAEASTFTKAHLPEESAEAYVEGYWQDMLQAQGRWVEYLDIIEKQLATEEMGNDELNAVCWKLYEDCDDSTALSQGVAWMKQACAEQTVYEYLDTYAWLLYKTGDMAEAKTQILRAIEVGKQDDKDVSYSEKMLELL